MVSLNDLRSAAVALDWHEAIAAGAALATLLADAHAPSCPHPADIAVLPSGDLRIAGPGQIEGSAAAGVARVIGQLLESTPHPAELRQVIEGFAGNRHGAADGVHKVDELLAALAFYERPGRRGVLAAVVQRAVPALEQASRVAALEALTERTRLGAGGAPAQVVVAAPVFETRGQPRPVEPEMPVYREALAHPETTADPETPVDHDPAADGGLGRLILPAAIAVLAFVTMAYVAAAWLDRAPSPGTVPVEDEIAVDNPVSPGALATPPAVASPRPRREPLAGRGEPAGGGRPSEPAAEPVRGTASVPAAVPPVPAPLSPSSPRVDVRVAERDGRVVPSPVAPIRPGSARAAGSGHIFQSSDTQVTPAVLIRPHLPDVPPPDIPDEQIGTLEFVVGQTGAVEHVHLVSPANRYQERMLVAAAKTWQFRPATHEGKPVRYRTRIRVTL